VGRIYYLCVGDNRICKRKGIWKNEDKWWNTCKRVFAPVTKKDLWRYVEREMEEVAVVGVVEKVMGHKNDASFYLRRREGWRERVWWMLTLKSFSYNEIGNSTCVLDGDV